MLLDSLLYEFAPGLLTQTYDPDPMLRTEAARKLCPCHVQNNITAVWDRLLVIVDDPDPKLRRRVRKLLAQYRRTGKINVL